MAAVHNVSQAQFHEHMDTDDTDHDFHGGNYANSTEPTGQSAQGKWSSYKPENSRYL